MPNTAIPAADSGLPETVKYEATFPKFVSAPAALWHKSEGVANRGDYPGHLMNLLVDSQEKLMRRIIDAPCSTDEDLSAKLKFAAFIVESEWQGENVEKDIIESIAADYDRLCRDPSLPPRIKDRLEKVG